MTGEISEKVIERIKEKKICPKSCWRFRTERFLVMFLLGIFLLIGATALSLILELDDQLELENIITRPKGLMLAISSFPYFWLIIVMVFSALAVADFFRTRSGYRYRIRNIALIFGGSMLVLGTLFYSLGISEKVHAYLAQKIKPYSKLVSNPHSLWSQPDDGLLSGLIVSVDPLSKHMNVIDWSNNTWNVDYSQALLKPGIHLKDGDGIKIIGEPEGKGKFKAEKISPWMRGFMKVINQANEEGDELYQGVRNEIIPPPALPAR